jgi:twitching motility protein PilU
MERDQAIRLTQNLLKKMVDDNGSDLFITADFPPAIKIDGGIQPYADKPLTPEQSSLIVRSIMNDKQSREFDATKECNFAIAPQGIGRFRVSAFVAQGNVGAVLRTIETNIPTFDELELPAQLKEVAMTTRGLCLVVGGTGTGKSTTLAAMIGYRNANSKGHIITIEDPVEFVHPHNGCVVTHREVGVDTESWHNALKNTLRQAPDVIMIGEIRDRETMEYGIQFAETGHLCVATLHANSANQALDRIINFFPEERRHQLLMDLSLNVKAMISQRLIPRENDLGRVAAMEIMLSSPLINDLIFRGEVAQIKEVMAKSTRLGMQTFDQALFRLFEDGIISYEEALRNADSKNELRLKIKLESKREGGTAAKHAESLHLLDDNEKKSALY